MIDAIIIDDEQHCIDRLAKLLKKNCRNTISLTGTYRSVEEGMKAIQETKTELVFLDVEIHDKTGFELLRQLPEINFDVIFTTAHDKYAVQAFKFSAVDYLLKPIDADDLTQSINKLREKRADKETAKKIKELLHNLNAGSNASIKIGLPEKNKTEFIAVDKIIRCEGSISYTNIFLKDKRKLTVTKPLKYYEELLSDYNFYRVHNSHLINLAHVKSYNKGKGGFVIMEDDTPIDVATRRKEEFLKKMML